MAPDCLQLSVVKAKAQASILILAVFASRVAAPQIAAAESRAPSAEDQFRQQAIATSSPADPRDFNGLWWPDRAYGDQRNRPAPDLKPGVSAPAQQLGPSANNSIVKCMPAIRVDGIGSGMSELYVQTPGLITLIAEEDHDIRQIHLNARTPAHLKPSLTGFSSAHWEGDTLVVKTVGLKDPDGTPRPALRITERIRKVRSGSYLEHQVTFDDPTRYMKPYSYTWAGRWRPDLRIAENICEEEYQDYKVGAGGATYSDAVGAAVGSSGK